MPYISRETLVESLSRLKGTADHLIKIWFVLKVMGLKAGTSVLIDTSNSTDALKRLFSFGDSQGDFFVPFGHTKRFMTMKHDASRSIIQTTLQRWASSDSVVTVNPTGYLDISKMEGGKVLVQQGRTYPLGLGISKNGFALKDNGRVAIPDLSFAVWLFVREPLTTSNTKEELISRMKNLLNLVPAEYEVVFVPDDLEIELKDYPLTESEINAVCIEAIESSEASIEVIEESFERYSGRVKNLMTIRDVPSWLQVNPYQQFEQLIKSGEKAVLLYGPPRTGKTRAIDSLFPRGSSERETIQIHEGWTYENLIIGMQPTAGSDKFDWQYGPLAIAINNNKKCIVLEEINRTKISQALGEVFSLIESAYRGEINAITLPNGKRFWIEEDVQFIFTMNTIDESTEDVDDALLGRIACVEFPPRVEDLTELLAQKGINEDLSKKIREVYTKILSFYPLGHGYFAGYRNDIDFLTYYVTRIRPTLVNHFQSARKEIVDQIDNAVDGVFR